MLLEGRNAVIYGGGGAIGGAVARIRVLTLQTGGVPESISEDVPAEQREAITAHTVGRTMLGRAATLEDVGNVAAFAASGSGPRHDGDLVQHHLRLGVRLRIPCASSRCAT